MTRYKDDAIVVIDAMKRRSNGDLQAAMALLLHNEVALMQSQTAFVGHMHRTEEEFARLNRELEQIKIILLRHERILNDLPEAIRQKVGFKTP